MPAVTGAVDTERLEPVDELAGGAARERDGEHVARLGLLLADPERDPAGEHARLARTGGREDRERHVRIGDGRALVRVEIGEQRVGVTHGCDRIGRVRRKPCRARRGKPCRRVRQALHGATRQALRTREGPE